MRIYDSTPRHIAAVGAGLAYVGAIVLANWMLRHVGSRGVGGNHFLPVGFGLVAPSGVYAAAIAFPARDIVQRAAGRPAGAIAILVGAMLSAFVSSPTVAVASGVTFLVSETIDFIVFAALQRRWFVLAVLVSSLASIVIDSALFLRLVDIPWSVALAGQIVGKTWVILAITPVVYGLRRVPSLRFDAAT